MIQRPTRTDGLAQTLLKCLPLLLTVTSLAVPPAASGQQKTTTTMETEIWMSGTGVAMLRRVPQDLPPTHPDNQDFARSMRRAAQQHADQGDWQTAEWLNNWARGLTDDQDHTSITGEFHAGTNFARPATLGVWHSVHPKPLSEPPGTFVKKVDGNSSVAGNSLKQTVLNLRNRPELAPDARVFIAERNSRSRADRQTAESGVLPANAVASVTPSLEPISARRWPPASCAETTPQPERPAGPADSGAGRQASAAKSEVLPDSHKTAEPDRNAAIASVPGPTDSTPEQLATVRADLRETDLAAPTDCQPATGTNDQPVTISAVRSVGEPITVALISFAAGIVSCAAICLTLCFLPIRPAVDRRIEIRDRPKPEIPAPRRPTVDRPVNDDQVVAEFFDRNVELYQELARTG